MEYNAQFFQIFSPKLSKKWFQRPKIIVQIASDGVAGDYTKLLEKLLPFSAKLDLLAPRNLPFKAKHKIDMGKIVENLRELGYMQLKNYKLQNEAMKNANEWGQQLSRSILLMALYRTLHRTIADNNLPVRT